MLFRFSLYGFLKNQRYFEPFLILALRERGLSFLQIGSLVGFRELCVNLMEIPSGAVADLYGRRRCMVLSCAAYILSFAVLARSSTLWQLFGAMLLFATGDAFRTGTHKAIIMDWLRRQGREQERTEVYGLTRSWSQVGAGVSVLIAAAIVFRTDNYSAVFWCAIVPYMANLINLACYPGWLDGERRSRSPAAVVSHLWQTCKQVASRARLRRLVAESMGFQGVYAAAKDYLQPLLRATALALPLMLALPDRQRTAVVVAVVQFALYMLASVASRRAHRVASLCGGEERAAWRLWWAAALAYGLMCPFLLLHAYGLVIACFVLLGVLQNLWRPIQVSRYDMISDPGFGATILSVDSQAKSLATMVAAPLLGLTVDLASRLGSGAPEFWPVSAVGLAAALALIATRRRAGSTASPENP